MTDIVERLRAHAVKPYNPLVDGPLCAEAAAEITRLRAELAAAEARGVERAMERAAIVSVAAERQRQIEAEGWSPEHDDAYAKSGALVDAAVCYASFAEVFMSAGHPPDEWPWAASWWKPADYRRNLVKAAALLVAEIERHDRAAIRAPEKEMQG